MVSIFDCSSAYVSGTSDATIGVLGTVPSAIEVTLPLISYLLGISKYSGNAVVFQPSYRISVGNP